jgi:hypothetical protein
MITETNHLKIYIKILKFNPVRDLILVEKDKHHNIRHAVGMPLRHIMLHTYGMLLVLE